jgi:uncharacterized protein GlcG (DUF336 family)
VIEAKNIGLEEARKIIDAMLEYTTVKKPGDPMAHAVVDNSGVLVCFARMDRTCPIIRRMAENKAYTAIMWRKDTREIFNARNTDPNMKIECFGEPDRQAVIPGGNLLKTGDGYVVGAVASSGRHFDEDEEVALIGVKTFEQLQRRSSSKTKN